MNRFCHASTAAGILVLLLVAPVAKSDPCLEITLTGTMGGPPTFDGLAGSGTLVRYGDDANDCDDVRMQFDAGRGTNVRLSELGLTPNQLTAVFFTHIHSDHVDGFADVMQNRWHFLGGPLDVVCSDDAPVPSPPAPPARFMSCANLAASTGDAFFASGEIAQRRAENPARDPGGPAALVNLLPVPQPLPEVPTVVWTSPDGAVEVRAIRSRHVAGHLSYRVDSPAGNVVIGGDAGNDIPAPPRLTSTSANVELLAEGADVLVHSTIHPVMGPGGGSGFPPPIFFRQSTATDIGAMAARAGVGRVMLTHLIPSLGSPSQGPFPVPGGALEKNDYKKVVKEGGYRGKITVGRDLSTVRLPAKGKKKDDDDDSDSDSDSD